MKKNIVIVRIGIDAHKKDLKYLSESKNVRNFPSNVIYFDSFGQLFSVLTEKKMELVDFISKHTGKNVKQISFEVDRKEEAVSRDLHQLNSIGLVDFEKKGKEVYPKVKFEELVIPFKTKKGVKID